MHIGKLFGPATSPLEIIITQMLMIVLMKNGSKSDSQDDERSGVF